jgi:hypothetical protein
MECRVAQKKSIGVSESTQGLILFARGNVRVNETSGITVELKIASAATNFIADLGLLGMWWQQLFCADSEFGLFSHAEDGSK